MAEWIDGTSPVLSCLYLDLDGFKAVNDRFGHGAGDRLLGTVGSRIASSVRRTDLVYRLGGDEFVILAPATDEGAAASLANRIVSTFSDPFDSCVSDQIQIGVSIGGATSRPGGIAPKDAVIMADEALYAAKREGKGRYHAQSRAELLC